MSKKTILEISLYAQYYKKDIRHRYMINNKSFIITNDAIDILDKPQEKLYIEPWTKKIERDEEIKRLNNIIDELEKYINKMIKEDSKYNDVASRYGVLNCKNILDKLKELKEGKK